MSESVLLSIIIPSYHRSMGLRCLLNSIWRQQPWAKQTEIIVVDNAQQALFEYIQVKDEFITKGMNIKLVHEPATGISSARNSGVCIANGKFIGFLDDDEELCEGYLELLYKKLADNNEKMIYGGPYHPILDEPAPVWLKPSYFSVNHGVVALILENGTCLDGGNVIIPKSIFDQIGYFSQDFGHVGEEIDYGDDTDFLMRAGEIGAIQSYDPDLYILHHIPARKQSIQWFAQQKRKSSYQKAVLYITHHKELRTHPDQLRLKLHFLRRSVVELMEWGVCCIGIVFRDRKEFPFYQNYTIEKILQVYGKMLMTWHIFRLLL